MVSLDENKLVENAKKTLKGVSEGKERIDTAEDKKQIRASLKKLNYYNGDVERDPGDQKTKEAVIKYQSNKNLTKKEGIVGPETARAMLTDLERLAVPGVKPPSAVAVPKPEEEKIRISRDTHQKLTNRRIHSGETPGQIADQVAQSLAGEKDELVAKGYLQPTEGYQKGTAQKQIIEDQRTVLSERRHHLKAEESSLRQRQRHATTRASRHYLGSLIENQERQIRELDKIDRTLDKRENKVQQLLQKEDMEMQRRLRNTVLHKLPSKIIAGRTENVLDRAGLSNLVDRLPERVPSGAGRGAPIVTRVDNKLPHNEWVREAISVADKLRVPPSLVVAVMLQESQLNPDAVSPKGALGLMQLMPGTASGLGVDPSDPMQNIKGGVSLLKKLTRQYGGDLDLILAAYNAGEGAVQKSGNNVPPYPETQNYIERVRGYISSIEAKGGDDWLRSGGRTRRK